jgi:hypothetical protein
MLLRTKIPSPWQWAGQEWICGPSGPRARLPHGQLAVNLMSCPRVQHLRMATMRMLECSSCRHLQNSERPKSV